MPRPATEPRPVRRRRSALGTPAFVDRMDVADDADGRVAIFSVEESPPDPGAAQSAPDARPSTATRGAAHRLGAALDSRYAAAFIAAALVGILVLGLLLTRR